MTSICVKGLLTYPVCSPRPSLKIFLSTARMRLSADWLISLKNIFKIFIFFLQYFPKHYFIEKKYRLKNPVNLYTRWTGNKLFEDGPLFDGFIYQYTWMCQKICHVFNDKHLCAQSRNFILRCKSKILQNEANTITSDTVNILICCIYENIICIYLLDKNINKAKNPSP